MITLNEYLNLSMIEIILFFYRKFKSKFFPTSHHKMVAKWYREGGDFDLLFNNPLNSESIVFDIGGFTGNFVSELFSRSPCKIYIFEPIKKYNLTIKNRFILNNMIKVFPFGLSNKTESTFIDVKGQASSTFKKDIDNSGNQDVEKIKLVDVVEFINEQKISEIDLMNINIEGGEYDLIPRLFEQNKVVDIKYIQIQFHNLDKTCTQKKDDIRNLLKETHICEFCYEFVWEKWIRKDI